MVSDSFHGYRIDSDAILPSGLGLTGANLII